jgi:2-polyprenyl-3-methyl-5-hydroxy-6-metoxy-1,4-benzoquinol methylase
MNKAADQIISLYRRYAEAWIRQRETTFIEGKWVDTFASHLPTGARILDLGCGSGTPIARALMQAGFDVTGVDASPELIAQAKSDLPNARWLNADMRGLNLGQCFDGVIAWHSSFHLTPTDQRALFSVFERHVMSRGMLMFTAGPKAGETLGRFQSEPLYHASLDPDEYQVLLAEHAFDVVDYVAEDPECGLATIWLARKR